MKARPLRILLVFVPLLFVLAVASVASRRPFEALRIKAESLTPEESKSYEARLKESPDDFELRYQLLAYYSHRIRNSQSLEWNGPRFPEAQAHALWVARHHPDVPQGEGFIFSWDKGSYDEARTIWLRNVELHPDNPTVLGNAALFFRLAGCEPDYVNRVESLLVEAQRLDPLNPEWSYRLAEMYGIKYGVSLDKMQVAYPKTPLQFAQKEFAAYERALFHWKGRLPDHFLHAMVFSALRAEDLDKAERYAQELVDCSIEVATPQKHIHSSSGTFGNLVIAHVALWKGDFAAAEAGLLRLVPIAHKMELVGAGAMNLAANLLNCGRRDTVIEYLKRSRTVLVGHAYIDEWISRIEAGGTPKLDHGPWY